MDVKTAFLNGNLEHDIFMQPPPGCADYGQKDLVWKLEKSLYALKQASWSWYTKARNELKKLHFSHSDSDHAIFIYSNKGVVYHCTLCQQPHDPFQPSPPSLKEEESAHVHF